jgi:hypothetical protein
MRYTLFVANHPNRRGGGATDALHGHDSKQSTILLTINRSVDIMGAC